MASTARRNMLELNTVFFIVLKEPGSRSRDLLSDFDQSIGNIQLYFRDFLFSNSFILG